jgi:hypothetical protein
MHTQPISYRLVARRNWRITKAVIYEAVTGHSASVRGPRRQTSGVHDHEFLSELWISAGGDRTDVSSMRCRPGRIARPLATTERRLGGRPAASAVSTAAGGRELASASTAATSQRVGGAAGAGTSPAPSWLADRRG